MEDFKTIVDRTMGMLNVLDRDQVALALIEMGLERHEVVYTVVAAEMILETREGIAAPRTRRMGPFRPRRGG